MSISYQATVFYNYNSKTQTYKEQETICFNAQTKENAKDAATQWASGYRKTGGTCLSIGQGVVLVQLQNLTQPNARTISWCVG